uniref:OV-16 antigen n=1 Tax=Cacopsylla melanoneura TaxID=428564 RepID=A0A8D9EX51_9HEMI
MANFTHQSTWEPGCYVHVSNQLTVAIATRKFKKLFFKNFPGLLGKLPPVKMCRFSFILWFSIVTFTFTFVIILAESSESAVSESMESNQVVPEVISKAPQDTLKVSYKDGHLTAELGNELKPDDLKEAPQVSWKADADSYYTLVMTDPDAPSRKEPKAREWRHWLVVNIPGSDIAQGQTITEYAGPTPPKGTGLHRYVLLVYKQPNKLDFEESKVSNWARKSFSVEKFAHKHNLQELVAGNFYQAQNH